MNKLKKNDKYERHQDVQTLPISKIQVGADSTILVKTRKGEKRDRKSDYALWGEGVKNKNRQR